MRLLLALCVVAAPSVAADLEMLRGELLLPGAVGAIRNVGFEGAEARFLGDVAAARLTRDDLGGVYFLTPPGAKGPEYAALVFVRHGEVKSSGYAQVLRASGRKLWLVQQFRWDEALHGKLRQVFDPETKTLTVRAAHFLEGDSGCCPSAEDVIGLRWRGGEFVQTSNVVQLSEAGKRQGKKLGP